MAVDLHMKVGDRRPVATATLRDANGTAVDLTGATVTFTMRPLEGGALTVAAAPAAVVGDPTLGQVEYDWAEGDTATAGLYLAEWGVLWGAGEEATVPASGQLLVQVAPAVADAPALSAADLAWLRSWVGAEPSESDLAERVGRLGGRVRAALEVLRTRQADMLASPAKYKLPDQGEFDVTKNLDMLAQAVAALEMELPGDTGPTGVTGLVLTRGDTWTR